MAFSGTLQKCKGCDKVVHFIEMLKADGIPYHKACFKCSHCHSVLANRIPSKNSSFFSGTQEKCSACNKTVYPMEKPLDIGSSEKMSAANAPLETKLVDSNIKFSMEALLQGKPKRLDQRVKGMPNFSREDMAFVNPEIYGNVVELENFLATSPIKEHEDNDWTMVEDLARTGGREEVKLISSSTRGFVVSFGSLIGFLPYCNLPARWKFLAFESWLRGKALDPSKYKQNLGVVGKYRIANKTSLDSSLGLEIDLKVDVDILPDMKLEDLLKIYDQEKLIFLSSFVGQKIKVYVASSDRKSKRLIFSVKPKEKEEIVEKKKSVMAKLSVGDVVKCCIKKITYFGIFVEFVKAKVHRLDFSLERIFLSLKETTPDPLIEALEAVWFIWHPCLRMKTSYLPDQETECKS
ncbi:LIM domain-containing protein PLIM2b [Camellia lanceoleosa]|uniref:LIM domain-containing protein PLIM2b n=1 Tax=Camellia lanceoleosa TaxID=1840588 RepID=A0ACC0G3M7_9ERIC|nr:LIM domain-containing protein PLIM2b [Camellia lanceoleosa]